MKRAMRSAGVMILAGLSASLSAGCLPGDTRPPPGSVYLTAEPSPAVLSGLTTDDGWHISFEKLLVGLGGVWLSDVEPQSCDFTPYEGVGYGRFFDFTAAGQQKLAQVFALGECALHLEMFEPGPDAPRGKGVTSADLALMHETGLVWDPICPYLSRTQQQAIWPVSVYVRGVASQGARIERFTWAFPVDGAVLHDCAESIGVRSGFTLHGGDALELAVVVHGEELFRSSDEEGAPFVFDTLASADANKDQNITLEELTHVLLPSTLGGGVRPACDPFPWTLADDMMYKVLHGVVRLGNRSLCTDP